MNTARTIAHQLGSQALLLMGTKQLIDSDNALLIKVGRNPKSVSYVKIELNAGDLYDVTSSRVRASKITTVATNKDVFVGDLHATIENQTGLYLHF
jgi:hypothetical protein